MRHPGVASLWLLSVAAIICLGAFIGGRVSLYVDLAFILLLGLPHGALDVELARPRLCGGWGRGWFPVFAILYLAPSGGVLLAWHLVPVPALAFFLALSVLHFGEDRRLNIWQMITKGGAPIFLPVLFHPAATFALLAIFTQAPLGDFPLCLTVAACLWLALVVAMIWQPFKGPATRLWQELILLALLYAVFPPLDALAVYFVCYHSPGHMRDIIGDRINAPR